MNQGFRITITVGTGKDKYGAQILLKDRAAALSRLRIKLAQAFGGYTETEHYGGWISPKGELVQETSTSFTTILDVGKLPEVAKAAEWARVLLLQDEVLVTREALDFEFVQAKPRPVACSELEAELAASFEG